jgi:hypothetical protein
VPPPSKKHGSSQAEKLIFLLFFLVNLQIMSTFVPFKKSTNNDEEVFVNDCSGFAECIITEGSEPEEFQLGS